MADGKMQCATGFARVARRVVAVLKPHRSDRQIDPQPRAGCDLDLGVTHSAVGFGETPCIDKADRLGM